MEIRKLMNTNVEVIPLHASLQDAAERMRVRGVSCLAVVDGYVLMGTLADCELALTMSAGSGGSPRPTRVSDAMSRHAACCYDDQDVETAAATMDRNDTRNMLVLDRLRDVVGIVSREDLTAATRNVKGTAPQRKAMPLVATAAG